MSARPVGYGWVLALMLCVASSAPAAATRQAVYATPDEAVAALIAANRAGDTATLVRILGPGGSRLVVSGDPEADKTGREQFVAAYDAAHRIESEGERRATLVIGTEQWPFPIPVVKNASGWRFDTLAAEREILNRRIGRNELSVIQVCREYVQAQREFAQLARESGSPFTYAQTFASHGGLHDGLYWEVAAGEPRSPLGPLVAQAQAAGYEKEPPLSRHVPYHGYYYRMLYAQGPHAAEGARSYLVGDRMTRGFAMLAYPAEYGDSGIMTFIVSQDGIVYQKNLGRNTASLARAITQYDPDPSWHVAKSTPATAP